MFNICAVVLCAQNKYDTDECPNRWWSTTTYGGSKKKNYQNTHFIKSLMTLSLFAFVFRSRSKLSTSHCNWPNLLLKCRFLILCAPVFVFLFRCYFLFLFFFFGSFRASLFHTLDCQHTENWHLLIWYRTPHTLSARTGATNVNERERLTRHTESQYRNRRLSKKKSSSAVVVSRSHSGALFRSHVV